MTDSPTPKAISWVWLALLPVLVYLVGSLALVLAPDLAVEVLRKEGSIEHASHLLLVVASLVFMVAALWSKHWGAALICVYLALVLGEELDWGGVYEAKKMAVMLQESTGDVNFHNRWGGHSYLLFALPVPLYGLLALYPKRVRDTAARVLGPAMPGRSSSAVLLILLVMLVLGQLALHQWEQKLDELNEFVIYLWFTQVGVLAVWTSARKPDEPMELSQLDSAGRRVHLRQPQAGP